jgi:hypothetical protein
MVGRVLVRHDQIVNPGRVVRESVVSSLRDRLRWPSIKHLYQPFRRAACQRR